MNKSKKICSLILSSLFAVSALSGCAGGNNSSSSSSSSPKGDVTIETIYAQAKDLGFEGTLEEFKEYVKGDEGVGIEEVYVEGGRLYIALNDGSEPIDCGKIKGEQGEPGAPGAPGEPGQDGATWLSGVGAPTSTTGVNVGDFYFDQSTGDVYEYTSTGWKFSTKLKPDQPYVGYDGYVWEGANRTEQMVELAKDKYEIESTIALKDNQYFGEKSVATSFSKIAVMSGYQSYSGNTLYSNKIVKELVFYAETAGMLEIGKVNLSTGVANLGVYSVVAGKNVVALHIEIDAGETLAIGGGQSTVNLLAATNVGDASDTCGEYSKNMQTFACEKTDGVNDKLLISATRAERGGVVTKVVHADARTFLQNSTLSAVAKDYAPYVHYDLNAYSNGRLKKIGLYVQSIDSLDGWQSFTIYRVKKNDVMMDQVASPVKEYTLRPSADYWAANGVTSTTVNKWLEFDVTRLGIEVGEDETLAFGKSTDLITWVYSQTKDYRYAYYSNCFANLPINVQPPCAFNSDFSLPVYAEMEQILTDDTYVEQFKEEEVFAKSLKGKKLSIMGDSISTFEGWNNNTSYNSTLGNNAVYYKNTNGYWAWLENVDQTWWKRTINRTGLELCVNNAWSGSYVWNTHGGVSLGSSDARALNLHNNNTNVYPDIIAVYLGTNDYIHDLAVEGIQIGGTLTASKMASLVSGTAGNYTYATPTSFLEGYAIMMHKIVNKYQSADVFCFTILPNMESLLNKGVTIEQLNQYNDAIRSVANYFNLPIVDLFRDSGITVETGFQYSADWSLVLPNSAGMKMISECFIKKLVEFYA
ncbi:MAG: hypothetical protein IJV80_01475 [Clostridia bacterium]|nr:hypothetical protein [Clostridia bacterium]